MAAFHGIISRQTHFLPVIGCQEEKCAHTYASYILKFPLVSEAKPFGNNELLFVADSIYTLCANYHIFINNAILLSLR